MSETRRVEHPRWRDELALCRSEGFAVLDLIAVVDESDRATDPGLDVVAQLFDPTAGRCRRRSVWTRVPAGAVLPSAADVWAGARWHERAAAELSGLLVEGIDGDDRQSQRLLLPPSYEGPPPLAKSTPLAARGSTAWPGAVEPGESPAADDTASDGDGDGAAVGQDQPGRRRTRRRLTPPGVPQEWPS